MSQLGFPAVEALSPEPREDLGQFFTPIDLAARIVRDFGVRPGMNVVEPSCGIGRFVVPLARAGANVTAVDIDPRMIEATQRELELHVPDWQGRVELVHGNFLSLAVPPPHAFDLAMGNPDWNGGVYAQHIAQWMRWAPRSVAVLPAAVKAGLGDRDKLIWRTCSLTREVNFNKRPGFGGRYNSGERDVGVYELVRRAKPREPGEVDMVATEWWDP